MLKLVERPVAVSIQFLVVVSQTSLALPTQRTVLGTPAFKVTKMESTEAPITTLSPAGAALVPSEIVRRDAIA